MTKLQQLLVGTLETPSKAEEKIKTKFSRFLQLLTEHTTIIIRGKKFKNFLSLEAGTLPLCHKSYLYL